MNRDFYIEQARFVTLGEEWNENIWNPKDNPSGYHALYYRTDLSDGTAILYTTEGEIELLPNLLYFVPAYSVLHAKISGSIQKYYIHFQDNSLEFGIYRNIFTSQPTEADSFIKTLLDIIVNNYTKNTYSAKQKVAGAMEILLSEIFANKEIEQKNIEKFRPVLDYIENHYTENISISELAKIMNISKMYFSNSFKASFHISPKQYILGKRLHKSQHLLLKTDMSIKEIANTVGQMDVSNYIRKFKKKTGITPGDYRRLYQK